MQPANAGLVPLQPEAPHKGGEKFSDLGVRIVSGIALGLVALAALVFGVWSSALLIAAGFGLMVSELARAADGRGFTLPAMLVGGWGAMALLALGTPALATTAMALAFAALMGLAVQAFRWLGPWFLYIGAALLIALALRLGGQPGLITLLWILAVVIATDVGAYFAGRIFGGPKLWPALSPGKTWAGAAGGLFFALLIGLLFARAEWAPHIFAITASSLLLSVASQAGDLLESLTKRHFGLKDSGALIPGHGGLLDRCDGLLAALLVFGLFLWPLGG